jgi:hypothetical protein
MRRKLDPPGPPPNDAGLPVRADGRYPVLADSFPTSVAGSDVLLIDVISFQVQVFDPTSHPPDFGLILPAGRNPALQAVRVFDTWSSVRDNDYDYSQWNDTNPASPREVQVKRIPLPISIQAIKITLRLWDRKTNRARQVTIVQDM